jgi:hypothetical protein
MKNDVTKPAPAALSDSFVAKLLGGIAESRATTIIGGGGKPFLRLLSGTWVFGQGNEEIQEGSQWVINTASLGHGYCCWVKDDPKNPKSKSQLRGEIMISMSEPKPQRPPPIDDTPYVEQRAFDAKCFDGTDAGTEVLYKTNSLGGMRAIDDLLVEIQTQLSEPGGRAWPCPVITLNSDFYPNKTYGGRTYYPIFDIVAWADMDGHLQPVGKPVVAPAEKEASPPARPGRAPKPSLRAADEPVPEQPVSTTQAQAHTGQRRRPVAR